MYPMHAVDTKSGFLVYRTLKCCVLLLLSPVAIGIELPDLLERLTPSVVGVGAAYPLRTPTGGHPPRRLMGTGFVVESGGKSYVITNAHVIPTDLDNDGREQLAVFSGRGNNSQQRFAQLLKNDAEHDLAVLSYEGAQLPPMTLASGSQIRAGERVAFTGFPIGAVLGLYPTTHEGIVSAITPVARPVDRGRELSAVQVSRLRKPFDVYQLDAIAYPGNSGSAVYRVRTGEVIGVMNSVFVKESRETLLSAPSGIAYAIPVAHLQVLLEELE
ncbi:serine protease [Congregibacter brevis]|uniref:Serine protease n=1 Tax=Congregibacter brevis TaxID=3081201 RepID=A0ABZ0IFE0_9GAMM|nr:serine protease [Congregibacter sp. IMCC45268]